MALIIVVLQQIETVGVRVNQAAYRSSMIKPPRPHYLFDWWNCAYFC